MLDAARGAFVAADSIDVGLEEIATAAGVAKSTVLYHFGSRAGLLRALLRELSDEQLRSLSSAGAPGTVTWVTALVRNQGTDDGRLLFRLGDELVSSGQLDEADPRPVLTAVFETRIVEGDARLVTAAVLELCRQRVHDHLDDETAAELVEGLYRGVRLGHDVEPTGSSA